MAHPFVDVWDFKTALAFMVYTQRMERHHVWKGSQKRGLGITNKMLLDAIYSSGGGINRSGHYPITEEIKEKLEGLKNVSLDQIQIQWKE